MTPDKLYESFIVKVNANAQTNNVAVDRGRFCLLFNEASVKFIEWNLDKKNEDDFRSIQQMLTPKTIKQSQDKGNHQLFTLPSDYLDLETISALASSDCCSQVPITMIEIKAANEEFIISDSDTEPSIDYRETPYYLQDNKVKVFTKDFTIDSIDLIYYRYPKQIQLIDEDDPESGFRDNDQDLDFDKKALDRIISIAAADYDLNTANPKLQADKLRVSNKF